MPVPISAPRKLIGFRNALPALVFIRMLLPHLFAAPEKAVRTNTDDGRDKRHPPLLPEKQASQKQEVEHL
jgi:hypothetical protein